MLAIVLIAGLGEKRLIFPSLSVISTIQIHRLRQAVAIDQQALFFPKYTHRVPPLRLPPEQPRYPALQMCLTR